ncbi:CheR family methyltransferase [Shewanella youngdeokensis]|uniref:Chemotaxis protein methyltransferase n=1 Tax=Shewanella youngdeokensis TaxID=2999068 RepID=A0ABZ0K0Y0_9GAMM|nr:protein-glutamate O-methyltransferase CheR [Shewanella sp. DAU334]
MVTDGQIGQLTERDFKTIVALIFSHAGISLADSKKHFVCNRLSSRLRERKLSSFHDYIQLLKHKQSAELVYFINELTTNLTSFFREPYHFDLLAEHINRHLLVKSKTEPLKIWCSACSTGEEAYSIAMTMMEVFGSATPPVKILATDLNTQVLATARKGSYSPDQLSKLSAIQRKKFFTANVSNSQYDIKPEVKALVRFKQLNLVSQHWPMTKMFDVIFCRNVMIYFDKPTQKKLLQRFASYLPSGSLLFLGHSESVSSLQNDFKLISQTMYKRM